MNTSEARKKKLGHAISPQFMRKLQDGEIYAPIVDQVRKDKSLDMQFRGNYKSVDIYFKGKVMRLKQNGALKIDGDYTRGLQVPKKLADPGKVKTFLDELPQIKEKMSLHENERIEAEYEQLIIRANNLESGINSDYVILDRQYQYQEESGKQRRWDLVAVYWPDKKKRTGHLAVIEVKQGTKIGDISDQVSRYNKYLKTNMPTICSDMEKVLKQKLDLGLITRFAGDDEQSRARRNNLNKLSINTSIEHTEVLIYLVDYNPKGNLTKNAMSALTSQKQIRQFKGGFALWRRNSEPFHQRSVTK